MAKKSVKATKPESKADVVDITDVAAEKKAKQKERLASLKPKTENAEVKLLRERITEEVEAEIRAMGERDCGCGCGERTRSTFKPGHDAKLRSRLVKDRVAKAVEEKAKATLIRAPKAARKSARVTE